MVKIRYPNWLIAFALTLPFALQSAGQTTAPARPTPNQAAQQNPNQPGTEPPAALPQIEKMDPPEIPRGQSVKFTGQGFPAKPDEITVYLNGTRAGTASLISSDKTQFIFGVPQNLPLGRYNVRVEFKLNNRDIPFPIIMPPDSTLTVFSEEGKSQPKVTAVYPLVSYPEKQVYGFDLIGEGFSTRESDNGLVLNQTEVPVCWSTSKDCQSDTNQAQGKVINAQQLHFEWKIPPRYQGGGQLQIRVGQNYSSPVGVTLSRVGATFPRWISIAVVVGIFAIVLGLLSRGFRNIIQGRKYSILSALFLDAETETYSLSRCQFFIWTTVSLLTYSYLLLSRSLVQGRLEFVDVPSGLPGIILISGSTAILAQGITKSKGPKGAGEIHPSMTDFISTGGVVVPERFQFFIWTIVGAAVFVFLVFLNDPGTIQDLPQVPTGFLELMGVSSVGYLGGKVSRRAGPVIDEIITSLSSLELTLKGRNLSKDAGFRIGDEAIRSDAIENLKPEIVEADAEGEPNTAKVLRIKLPTPKNEWLKDDSQLTIINPDGQKAVLKYDVGPIITGPVQVQTVADVAGATLTLKGLNISSDSKVTIESPEGTPLTEEFKVQSPSTDTLVITITKPLKPGVVIVTNPDQRSSRAPYTL